MTSPLREAYHFTSDPHVLGIGNRNLIAGRHAPIDSMNLTSLGLLEKG